jgi:anti-anti-sigma regulatory factor/two-component sensor histidine kinase
MTRLATIGQISAGIAHEIRNPLTAVKGFLQLLQEKLPEEKYLDIMNEELERAILTVQNLLHVSKPDTDDEPYTAVSLCTELESILYLFQDQLYQVKLETDFRDKHALVLGRTGSLKKALFNLIKNGIEAIQGEGLIKVTHYVKDACVHIEIEDSGEGIPEEKLGMLGTPFYTTKTEGTGLGLVQVFSTIYEHGASIEVDSAPGRGTRFHLTFPLKTEERTGVIDLNMTYQKGQTFQEFYKVNEDHLLRLMRMEAPHIYAYIEDPEGQAQLDQLVLKVIALVAEERLQDLLQLGRELGYSGARNNFPLTYKLELIQATRKIYWEFTYNYHRHIDMTQDDFFQLERKVNSMMDAFFGEYFASYLEQKDKFLTAHRELIEDISVTIIPLSATLGILPIAGTIDTYRAKRIQERALQQIAALRLQKVVIDLSSVSLLDTAVVTHLFKIVEGLSLLGCKAIVTGIRPEVANAMIELGISFTDRVETLGTLQQALETYGLN